MSSTRVLVFVAAVFVVAAVMPIAGAGAAPSARPQAAAAPSAASVTLFAQQDSWTDEDAPGTNFGSDADLHVGFSRAVTGAPLSRHTLVQFDLSPLPAGVTVVTATLELYQVSATLATRYLIQPDAVVQGTWNEATVNWSNEPAASNQGDPSVALDTTDGWKAWDVTQMAQGWATGRIIPNQGLVLHGDLQTLGERIFRSRKDPKLAPRLILEYSRTPAPTRTPMPTWTPIPSPTPTQGPPSTPTPVLPAFSYVKEIAFTPILLPALDLSIDGIEITQGIQCFDTSKGLTGCPNNSLPVVTKKDSTARIYLHYSGPGSSMNNVPVRLHIFANSVEYIVNASGKAKSTLSQVNASDSVNVWFNVNFTNNVVVSFYAEVDPGNTIVETNETNNRYPASGTIPLTFQRRGTMTIVGQRLRYHPSGYSGTQYAGGWAVNGGAASWYNQVLPLRNNAINYALASGYLDWTTSLGDGSGQHALISTLNSQWIFQNALAWLFGGGAFTGARQVYGWAPSAGYGGGHADMPIYPHAGGLGVVGIGSDAPGSSTDTPGSGALIFGHELTHDYNVYHTNTADACGSNDGNSDFPYGTSSIQEFGYNPVTGKIYDPSTTHDLMSYCPSGGSKQGWISPFTWNKMFGLLPTSGPIRAQPLKLAASGESLVVNATISNPVTFGQDGGHLGHLYKLAAPVPASVMPAGDYAIEMRDGPTVLYSQTFTISFVSEYSAHGGPLGVGDPNPTDVADVSFVMPWQVGTTSIALLRKSTLLDERAVTSNSPQVTITAPTQVVTWTTGTYTLTWTASDADGDPLNYSVLYSRDGGGNWSLLAEGVTGPNYSVNADALAGSSDARFRVMANDGVNVGYDETDAAIIVPNKAPMPIITHPAPGQIVAPGDLLVLQGAATDLEDGSLPDTALHWSSDKQGSLGIGPSLGLVSLTSGLHVITLTAMDSNGQTATASVPVYIGYGAYLPIVLKQ